MPYRIEVLIADIQNTFLPRISYFGIGHACYYTKGIIGNPMCWLDMPRHMMSIHEEIRILVGRIRRKIETYERPIWIKHIQFDARPFRAHGSQKAYKSVIRYKIKLQ